MRISEVRESTDIIKESTKEVHTDTELLLIPRLKSLKSNEEYAEIIKMFYGFFAPLEKKIEKFITENYLPDIRSRRKASSLKHDLFQLHVDADDVKICLQLPRINTLHEAFGALYVLEGSTLGGVHIVAMLKRNEHLQLTDDMVTFFKGYGEDNMMMWNKFRHVLNNNIATDEQLEQVTCSATDTFSQLKYWLQNNI